MTLETEVGELLRAADHETEGGSLHLQLLRVYSKLYLNGGQPKICVKSARKYLAELRASGIERAKTYEEMRERTCKPNWVGRRFIAAASAHYPSESLTDQQAIMLLRAGLLTEADFTVLPEGYAKGKKKTTAAPLDAVETAEEPKVEPTE